MRDISGVYDVHKLYKTYKTYIYIYDDVVKGGRQRDLVALNLCFSGGAGRPGAAEQPHGVQLFQHGAHAEQDDARRGPKTRSNRL